MSIFEWHPISISSSPHQQYVTLHIRKRGTWTTRLHDLAGEKKEISILLEGPYGSLAVDLTSNRYSMVMLLSGGIGVTPMQSIAHQLTYEHEWGERELKKLWFVWTARDPQVMSNMDVISNHPESAKKVEIDSTMVDTTGHSGSTQGWDSVSLSDRADASTTFMSGKGFTVMPSSDAPDEELELAMPLEEFIDDEDGEGDNEVEKPARRDDIEVLDLETGKSIFTLETMGGIAAESHLAKEGNVQGGSLGSDEEVLALDCYLTAKEIEDCGMNNLPFVNQSRPNMKKIFLEMRKEAMSRGEKRVAICVCAPLRLVSITREACVKYSNSHVRFDFHSEVFD